MFSIKSSYDEMQQLYYVIHGLWVVSGAGVIAEGFLTVGRSFRGSKWMFFERGEDG